MTNRSLEERIEATSALLNHIYNETWSHHSDTNLTQRINHEEATITLSENELTIILDMSNLEGLIEVRSPNRREEFAEIEEAAKFALKEFFTTQI